MADSKQQNPTTFVGTFRQNQLETGRAGLYLPDMTKSDPFRYFKTSREIIRLAVMLYVRFPLSLRNVEDLLHERGIGSAQCLLPRYESDGF